MSQGRGPEDDTVIASSHPPSSSSNVPSSSARPIPSLAAGPSNDDASSSRRPDNGRGHSRQQSNNSLLFSPFQRPGSSRPYSSSAASAWASPRGASSATSKGATTTPPDWYAPGPGRRVAYEDLTAIDWISEYTRERQRLRVLGATAGGGALGKLRLLLDSAQVWTVLVLTGLLVGLVAAAIDVTTDWLGDLKLGYCAGGPEGGRFYLSKGFCCYGYDHGSHCAGWRTWGETLGLGDSAPLGRWVVGYVFFVVFAAGLAFASALLVQEYSIHAKHSGIPEIKTVLGGFVIRKLLGTWTLITKSFGLCLSVASGMWLGKEGPLIHVACCCSNVFIKLFANINENEARKREVLSAAAASGISVAFGSPIGGVLFSLEQLAYYFPDKAMWRSFVCAMTAAFTLQALDPFRSGKLVLFQVEYSTNWNGFELIPYALLGVLGGIYGGLFIKANMFVARWKKANSDWLPGPIAQVLAVALLTAVINYPNSYMKIQASEAVSNLFAECSQVLDDQLGLCDTGAASLRTIVLLVLASVLGILLAIITFGLQIPAGIILPSMAVGALTGRAAGIVMELWVDRFPGFFLFDSCVPGDTCINPGTYAIIGAAAALGGVTRMTVSVVVIMFELTGALTYVLPIMIAVMISKWVGDAFSRQGIYEAWIRFNEYPFIDNSDETTPLLLEPDAPTASQLMSPIEDLVVLTATGHTVSSLTSILETHPHRGFPVVSDPRDAMLIGYISRAELAHNIAHATRPPRGLPPETEAFFSHQPLADPRTTLDLRPWMDQTPLTLPSRASLQLVVNYFQRLGLRYILFCDRGALQGLLTRKDVSYALNHGGQELRRAGDVQGVGLGISGGRGGGDDDDHHHHDDARGLLDDDDEGGEHGWHRAGGITARGPDL